jgi:hypothetical protein
MALETKHVGIEVAKKYRAMRQKDILRHFPKKMKGSVLYFLATGRDTKGILVTLNKLDIKPNGRSKMYNQTIEVSDWDIAEVGKRLELRYNSRRIYAKLERELRYLNEQSEVKRADYSYNMIVRLFTRYRDTTGGKLWEEIKELVNFS